MGDQIVILPRLGAVVQSLLELKDRPAGGAYAGIRIA